MGVLEPKSSVCQMIWQQWSRQYEGLFFLPKMFFLDNSENVYLFVCRSVRVSVHMS